MHQWTVVNILVVIPNRAKIGLALSQGLCLECFVCPLSLANWTAPTATERWSPRKTQGAMTSLMITPALLWSPESGQSIQSIQGPSSHTTSELWTGVPSLGELLWSLHGLKELNRVRRVLLAVGVKLSWVIPLPQRCFSLVRHQKVEPYTPSIYSYPEIGHTWVFIAL